MQKEGPLTVSDDQLPVSGKWNNVGFFIPTHSHPAIPTPIPNKLA